MSDSYTSSSYYYSSTTNTSEGTTTSGHRYSTTSHTEPNGTTTVRTARQDLGQPAVVEEHRYDSTGQEQLDLPLSGGTSAGGIRRITDLDEEDAGTYDIATSAQRTDANVDQNVSGNEGPSQSSKVYGTTYQNTNTLADEDTGGLMNPRWNSRNRSSIEAPDDMRIWI